jgi:hypothetical protein
MGSSFVSFNRGYFFSHGIHLSNVIDKDLIVTEPFTCGG